MPPVFRNAVYASSEFSVRRVGAYGHRFPFQRMWAQLESVNEVLAPPPGRGGGGGARLSMGERVTAFELRLYSKAPNEPGAQQLFAQRLTKDTGFLRHSGLLEVQFSTETLHIKSDTDAHLRDWYELLQRYIKEAEHVNAAQQAWERRQQAEDRAREAARQAEQRRLAAQRERKQQLDSALRYAGVARQGYRDGDFKAAYANYMAGIAMFLKVLPWYKADPSRAADYGKLSGMLKGIMDAAEDAKRRAAETYDLTVADTQTGGQARTSALLRGVHVVTDLVRERKHMPDALRTKGRDEFCKSEGGLKTRDRVVLEIYETEKSYLTALETLVRVYLDPLRQSEAVTDAQAAFLQNIGASGMVALNGKLLHDLSVRVRNWTTRQTVGDVFRQYAPFFKLYIAYANSFDKLAHLLRDVCDPELNTHSKTAQKILRRSSSSAGNRGSIGSRRSSVGGGGGGGGGAPVPSVDNLLIQPIQRIPRYVLLLKELLKCTQGPPDSNTGVAEEPTHPDFALCVDALSQVEAVARAVDRGMQVFKNQQKVVEVQESMVPRLVLLDRTRAYVTEADLPFFVCHTPSNDDLRQAGTGNKSKGHEALTYHNRAGHLAHFVLFSDSALVVAFPVPKARYEAALAAASDAAAAVDRGRYLNWAASAVMGADAASDAATGGGMSRNQKPAKYEHAAQLTVRQAGALNRAEFLAIAAQYCEPERLRRIVAHCHPDLPPSVLENCATRIVVSGCTELALQYDAPAAATASATAAVRQGGGGGGGGGGGDGDTDHVGRERSDTTDSDDAPPAPPPRVRDPSKRLPPSAGAGEPLTPQGAGIASDNSDEGDADSDDGVAGYAAVSPPCGFAARSRRRSGGSVGGASRVGGRKRVALRCIADFAASEVGHISCRAGEGLWGFLLSANSWYDAPPSDDDGGGGEEEDGEGEGGGGGGGGASRPRMGSGGRVRQIVTNTDLKRVTEGDSRAGGWWHGQNAEGHVGKFPASCVEAVSATYKDPAFAVELPECGPARAIFPLTMSFYETPHPVLCVARTEDERDAWLRAVQGCLADKRQSLAGLYHRGARLKPAELASIGMGAAEAAAAAGAAGGRS